MTIKVTQKLFSFFNKVSDIFLILCRPDCWIRVGKYSKEWDKELNILLSTNVFKKNSYSTCTALLGQKTIWIENHPYSSFGRYGNHDELPSRITALRAKKKLDQDFSEKFDHLLEEAEKIKNSVKVS